MAFVSIQSMPGASAEGRRLANVFGPPASAVRTSYPSLLRSSGFSDIHVEDRTDEYRESLAGWMAALDARSVEVRELIGDEAYDDRATSRQETLEAVEAGLLGRFMYAATRL